MNWSHNIVDESGNILAQVWAQDAGRALEMAQEKARLHKGRIVPGSDMPDSTPTHLSAGTHWTSIVKHPNGNIIQNNDWASKSYSDALVLAQRKAALVGGVLQSLQQVVGGYVESIHHEPGWTLGGKL